MSIYQIIKDLQSNSSTLNKQAILENNKNNEVLKLVFELTESPIYNFYIKVNQNTQRIHTNSLSLSVKLLKEIKLNLHGRNITGNAARDWIENVLISLSYEDAYVVSRMINRDLDCKTGTAIINKVWKGLIPEMPCMLASKMDEKIAKTIVDRENGYMVQTKMDGGRCMAVVNSTVTMLSRNGKELQVHGVFDQILSSCEGYVLDGELVVLNETGIEDRKTGNGLFTKAVRGTLSKDEAARLHYVVWDMIPIKDFFSGYCAEGYQERFSLLMIMLIKMNPKFVSLVDTQVVDNMFEINKYYQKMIDAGKEGAILKFVDSPWEDKRSKFMIKLKEEKDIDAEVIDVYRHSKKKDWIGSFLCRTRDGKVEFEVGSGLTEEDRARDPKFYLGKIIECKYNMLIEAKGRSTKSLFLPIFVRVREDKTQANSLEELK